MAKDTGVGFEFGWEDEIENDGSDFIALEEGDYEFTVKSFERGRYKGGDKIPACNMANLELEVHSTKGDTTIKTGLILHSKMEWKLCEFFTAIGDRKHGEKLKMDWKNIIGKTGKVHIAPKEWVGDDGETRTSNDVKKYIDPEKYAAKKEFTDGDF